MVTQASHGLGFTSDAFPGFVIQFFGLNQGKGDVTVKDGIVGQVDLLLAALTKQLLDLIVADSERGGFRGGWCWWRRCWFG